MSKPQILKTGYNAEIAYHLSPGRTPGVVFLTGFMSDMEGSKALRLERHIRKRGNQFLRFDYRGHGQSSDKFENGSIGDWLEDALEVIDKLTQGPQVIVGSSMGGWIMLLCALNRPDRVKGLVGIAPAPDFTDTLYDRYLTNGQRKTLNAEGKVFVPSEYKDQGYIITKHLLEEGHHHRLLHQPIPIDVPVRLIHGMLDESITWQTSLRLSDELVTSDVEVTLIKDGDHRLSSEQDLDRLCVQVDNLLDSIELKAADARSLHSVKKA